MYSVYPVSMNSFNRKNYEYTTMQAHHTPGFRVLAILLAVSLVLPFLFPKPVNAITVKEEEDLSKEVLKAVFQRFEIVEDPYIWRYVNAIGRRILAKMPDQPFRYRFYVIKEPTYNAFAIPAGHIFINSGLFAVMESEELLAEVRVASGDGAFVGI